MADTSSRDYSDSGSDSECETGNTQQQQNILSQQLERKIIIKVLPDGKNKRNRTHIHGLAGFMKKEDQLTLCKEFQKKFGTSMIINTENDKPVYIYSGDHKEKIMRTLLDRNIVAINEID